MIDKLLMFHYQELNLLKEFQHNLLKHIILTYVQRYIQIQHEDPFMLPMDY